MLEQISEASSILETRRAVMALIEAVNGHEANSLGDVGSDGNESFQTSTGGGSMPRQRADWMTECIITERQVAGGGTLVDPATPGQDVQYKVTVLDTGVETGWLSPVRGFDVATMGYTLAAVDTHGIIARMPNGTGAFDVHLILLDAEKLAGLTCA